MSVDVKRDNALTSADVVNIMNVKSVTGGTKERNSSDITQHSVTNIVNSENDSTI